MKWNLESRGFSRQNLVPPCHCLQDRKWKPRDLRLTQLGSSRTRTRPTFPDCPAHCSVFLSTQGFRIPCCLSGAYGARVHVIAGRACCLPYLTSHTSVLSAGVWVWVWVCREAAVLAPACFLLSSEIRTVAAWRWKTTVMILYLHPFR